MKKILAILFLAALVLTPVLAAVPEIQYSGTTDTAFRPTSARISALGESGIASAGRMDALFQNPAALAQKRFGVALPSFGLTVYNLQALLSDETDSQIIADAMQDPSSLDDDQIVRLAQDMVENVGAGRNEFLTTDVTVGFALGNLGLGVQVQEKLHTIANGSSNLANVYFVPEVNVGAVAALGLRIINSPVLNLDVGASATFVYKAYTQKIGASTMLSMLSGDMDAVKNEILWNTPTMAGWGVPVNLGVTLGLAENTIRISAVAENINSVYHMKSYNAAGAAINDIAQQTVLEEPEGYVAEESTEFTINNPWSLTLGVAFVPYVPLLHPVVSADLVDMLDIVTGREEFEWQNLLLHLNASVELNLLSMVALRAGVNRGYMSVGVGVDLPLLGIDASYGWKEFGSVIGDKPVDSFTIRFYVGYDKI